MKMLHSDAIPELHPPLHFYLLRAKLTVSMCDGVLESGVVLSLRADVALFAWISCLTPSCGPDMLK